MRSSKQTESPAQSWLCHGRVLLMPFKSLPFYPVWVLKRDQRSSALEATLPPPSPPSSVKCRADQPIYINVKGETMLFWWECGCRDVNAAGGRSLGHRHDTSAAARPDTGSLGTGTNQGQATAVPASDCKCSASQDREGFISVYEAHYYPIISSYLHLSRVLSFSPFHLSSSPWLQAGLHNSSHNFC